MKTTPWTLDKSDWPLIVNGLSEEPPNVIAMLYCSEQDDGAGAALHSYSADEQLAHAKLIAAAPELLAACEAMLPELSYWPDWSEPDHPGIATAREALDLAEAAIAKAKGKGKAD